MSQAKSMECVSHGKTLWHGQVICAKDKGGCGRAWHLMDDSRSPPEQLGRKCVCGATLTAAGSAMPICGACFELQWIIQTGALMA